MEGSKFVMVKADFGRLSTPSTFKEKTQPVLEIYDLHLAINRKKGHNDKNHSGSLDIGHNHFYINRPNVKI